uniref:Uncharacterized protein n=1 Tax=Pyricularia oryzae (strain P131) TaxID=1143193 RepID=L7JR96_PYRO1
MAAPPTACPITTSKDRQVELGHPPGEEDQGKKDTKPGHAMG